MLPSVATPGNATSTESSRSRTTLKKGRARTGSPSDAAKNDSLLSSRPQKRTSAHVRPRPRSTAGEVTQRLAPFSIRYTFGFESSLRRHPSGMSHSRTVAVGGDVLIAVTWNDTSGAGTAPPWPAVNRRHMAGCR